MDSQNTFDIFIVATPGLEDMLLAEVTEKGFADPVASPGGITVQGDIKPTLTGCSVSVTSSSLRFGGGILIPIADIFELSPAVNFTVGKFSSVKVSSGIACNVGTGLPSGDIPTADRGNYAVVQIGIGGEFVFGGHE